MRSCYLLTFLIISIGALDSVTGGLISKKRETVSSHLRRFLVRRRSLQPS
jgi:hypothetical protein